MIKRRKGTKKERKGGRTKQNSALPICRDLRKKRTERDTEREREREKERKVCPRFSMGRDKISSVFVPCQDKIGIKQKVLTNSIAGNNSHVLTLWLMSNIPMSVRSVRVLKVSSTTANSVSD
jgi:hypothetical protein